MAKSTPGSKSGSPRVLIDKAKKIKFSFNKTKVTLYHDEEADKLDLASPVYSSSNAQVKKKIPILPQISEQVKFRDLAKSSPSALSNSDNNRKYQRFNDDDEIEKSKENNVKKIAHAPALNTLLGSIADDPYNLGIINSLNQALPNEQEILKIIKKYPEIEGKILEVHKMLLESYGLVLVKLNKIVESLRNQKNIPLISEDDMGFGTSDYLLGRTLAGESGDGIVYIKWDCG